MADDEQSARSIPAPPKFNAPSTSTADASNVSTNNDSSNNPTANSDKQKITAPPPPKFGAPPPPPLNQSTRPAIDPAKAAALAAAKAAQHATPAQRERMVMEAAAQALAQRTTAAAAAAAAAANENKNNTSAPIAPPLPPGPYQPPSWASDPPTIPYTIEIMKQGTIISTLDLQKMCVDANKGYLTLGRAPNNDVLLDHPSSSRLHAVLEFKNKQEQEERGVSSPCIFLFDPGSTHGCYVNKARIAAGEHIPLNIGDMLRFGESTRMMILCGPAELMVEEGPSREQRKQAAALEALKRRKEKDAAAAKIAMAKAIAAGGGGGEVTWGFGDDARGDSDEENNGLKDEIDWREHAASKGLTDKQQKMAEKIRKREARITRLQNDSEKIQLKQRSMEEMSVGQANTLARNEEEIEKAMIEIEELEDQLVASIEDSISGRKKIGGGGGKSKNLGGKKRRRGGDDDSEDGGGDSDEDSFYDRTGKTGEARGGRARRAKISSGGGGGLRSGGGGGGQVVEDAASLYGSLETLKEEKIRVEALLQAETAKNNNKDQKQGDAFLPSSSTQRPTTNLNSDPIAAGGGAGVDPNIDSLDSFMAGVESTIESDRAASLRNELAQIESKIATTAKLLAIADPDGYYKPGSKAAEIAVRRAQKAMEIEKKRKQAEEEQKRVALAAKKAAETAFIEETEEDEDEEEEHVGGSGGAGVDKKKKRDNNVHELGVDEQNSDAPFGLQLQSKKETPSKMTSTTAAATTAAAASGGDEPSAYERRRAGIAASLQALKSSGQQSEKAPSAETDAATAQVLADLAVFHRASAAGGAAAEGLEEEKRGKEEDVAWLPPENQKGDGRTALNDKFGY